MIHLPAIAVFRHRNFLLFWLARIASVFAVQMQAVAIAWLVYDRARQTEDVAQSAFLLGMVGLAEFVPIAALSLFAGQAADRYDRKQIIIACYGGQALCGVALTIYAISGASALWPVFGVAALFGGIRAFMAPAMNSIVSALVPREDLPSAISWNSMAMQTATIVGPAGAGFLYTWIAWAPFAGMAILLLLRLRDRKASSAANLGNATAARPLSEIVSQPRFIVALGCAVGAYALMSFVMTGASPAQRLNSS